MAERQVSIGTDVATLFLFHPDDLAHRHSSPIGWYGYDFAYRRESAAGRLIAWSTGGDGGYLVRLTTAQLTAAEQAHASRGWSFPLIVRHGRVLVDNSNALPGEGQVEKPERLTDQWFELPNAAYRATVYPIDRADEDARALADYVVTFEVVEDIGGIAVADTPPMLEPFADPEPLDDQAPGAQETPGHPPRRSSASEEPFLWRADELDGDTFGALTVTPELMIVPRLSAGRAVSEELAEFFFPKKRSGFGAAVIATALEPDRLGLATEVYGRSGLIDVGSRINFRATAVVRIKTVLEDPLVPRVRVTPVAKPDLSADEGTAAAFRARLLSEVKSAQDAPAEGGPTAPAFELERLETLHSAEAVTGWALMQLQMPLDTRLQLWISSARERIAGIERLLSR